MSVNKLPKCKLVGTDGNVFALAGKVSATLKKAGFPEKAKEMQGRLFKCGSYDDALAMFG
jgi:hypothetical protein